MTDLSISVEKKHSWIAPSFDDLTDPKKADVCMQQLESKPRQIRKQKKGIKILQQEHEKSKKTRFSSSNDLWVDKHKPHTQVDLAVHKKKIAELQDFLQQSFNKKQGSILLLTGPSGAGKTATLQVLAEEMGIEIQEWINPLTDTYSDGKNWSNSGFLAVGQRYESQTSLFQDFLLRANRYPSLQMFNQEQLHQKLILVEDFPNIFFKNTDQFHRILRDYHVRGHCPLVFILSDSAGGDSNERLLFPKDIQTELEITNISFNPVAPTSLSKVLTRIASAEANVSNGRMKAPPKSVIEGLASASSGDVRGAINALQFACLKDTRDLDDLISSQSQPKLRKSSSGSAKSGNKATSLSKKKAVLSRRSRDSDSSLAAIGGKDTSLFLFRALGKILYCKRDPESCDSTTLPAHLSKCHRDPLTFNPEDVIERSQLSGDFFMCYLHENYLDFYTQLDDVVLASEYFSEADKLTVNWANRSLLLDYAAAVAVRGMLFSNSDRVSSASLGWKPLHKPHLFEVNKKIHSSKERSRYLFPGSSWTSKEFYTSLLPYLNLINVPLKEIGQTSFMQEFCKFGGKNITRWNKDRLDEKDIAVESNDTEETPGQQVIVNDNYIGPIDEEVVIEEYDD